MVSWSLAAQMAPNCATSAPVKLQLWLVHNRGSHVSHRQKPLVEEEQNPQEEEDDPEGREAHADLCRWWARGGSFALSVKKFCIWERQ